MPHGDPVTSTGHDLAITVAMLTYRRPELLPAALAALGECCDTFARAEVLVVDNDPEGSAEPVVGRFAATAGSSPVRYVHEPRPGISAARNRALDEAHGDLLIFIDDDELPRPGWLTRLVETYLVERPTAVVGPSLHLLEETADPWIVAGGFFVGRREPTGTYVDEAASNNLLLDLAQVRALGTRYDDRLGLAGGEDSLFSKQLVNSGGSIVWRADAEVVDTVPPARLTRRYVTRRAFRLANSRPLVDLMLADSVPARSKVRAGYVVGGTVRLGGGALRSAWGILARDRRHAARGFRTAVRGLGMLAGAFGHEYVEYAREAVPTAPAGPTGSGAADVSG